ncbi:MAG: hydrogenase formation protein HypD, partial [Candidatus Marinimicrobia bacterium]|nr:hydrogenase formation protein HypD [Candidatus Neomarinimicrobiota bacterium]
VKENGNPNAMQLMMDVFEESDINWRGIGVIPKSGLRIKNKYREFDANFKFDVVVEPSKEYPGCICGDIMRGVKAPSDCKLFAKACIPEDPKGACMVSDEGTCATYFKYVSRDS